MHLQLVEPGQNSNQLSGIVVGIDLGTTHSAVACVKDGKPEVLRFDGGSPLLPSVLSLDQEGFKVGKVLGETLRSTKRLMGRGPEDPICTQFLQLLEGEGLRLRLGPHALTPVEVAGHILSHIRAQVEKTLSVSLDGAVITVPAYFDEAARIATKQAAALAGIKVMRLINEPTAAALAYGLETGAEGIYAIYDFGGGTFDLSLLKLEKGIFQVLATGGDLTLGGDDIDHALAVHLKRISSLRAKRSNLGLTEERKGSSGLPRSLQGLAMTEKISSQEVRSARIFKEQLTALEKYEGLTRKDLESLALPFIQQTLKITEEVFREANLSPQSIEGVVLVGGMTRMPLVRQEVETFFGKAPLCNIDPDQAVALGAALSAHGLKHGSDTLLLDVTPLSLGLETMGGLVEKILPRNTPLPALASQEFTTHQDGQGGMIIHVVQGEREFAKDCRSLAQFELKGLPPLPAGVARVRVDFAVDVEGLLTVSAIEKTTGLSQHIEVRPSHGLSEKDFSQMILESQKHGKEDIQKRLEVEKNLHKSKG